VCSVAVLGSASNSDLNDRCGSTHGALRKLSKTIPKQKEKGHVVFKSVRGATVACSYLPVGDCVLCISAQSMRLSRTHDAHSGIVMKHRLTTLRILDPS
jgi:hypothetical protein